MAATTSAPTAPAPGFKPYNNIDEIAQAFLAGKLTEEQALALMQGIWMEDGTFTADEAMNAAKLNLQSYKDKAGGLGGAKTGPSVLDTSVVAAPKGTESPVLLPLGSAVFGGGASGGRGATGSFAPEGGAGGSAVTAPGGGPVVASPQAGVPSPFESLGESSPFAAYLKRFALPGYGQSVYQDYLTGQYAPSFGTFQAANYLNPESPTDFNQFLSGGDPFGRGQARNLFSQALGQGAQGQQAFQDALGGDFNSFIGNVLRGRYAAPVAQRMAGWLPGMQQQFTAETGGQPAEGAGFLNFLKQHYGL